MNIIEQNINLFRPDFLNWVNENNAIWKEFERRALEMASVRDKFSARCIFEVIRYYTQLSEKDKTFKLNNNYTADCGLLFELEHPEHAGFFEHRRQHYV